MSIEMEPTDLCEIVEMVTKAIGPVAALGSSHSFKIGECYLIRGVTLYHTGRLVSVTDTDLVLEDAAWIADTGRFADCLKSGQFSEVEPFTHPVIVPRGSIVDATIWGHSLPREQV